MRQRRLIPGLCAMAILLTLHAKSDSMFGTEPQTRPSRSYHVVHYKLRLRFEEDQKKVIGTTTITLVPFKSRLDSVVLNAVDLDVQNVLLPGGKSLRFANDGKFLTVYLDRQYTFADTISVEVAYASVPKEGLYFLAPDSTDPERHNQIWSQGEDMDNRYWFPCWDFPNDKATSEVIATVRDSWTLLSNGKLVDVTHDPLMRTKTFHWVESKPHASYLIMIAAGEYEIIRGKAGNVPLEYYLYKDRVEDGKRSLSATPAAMTFFEQETGFPYPWEKFAQIFIDDFMWGGMENTSAVTLNTSYLIDRRGLLDFSGDGVVAHELAHQWFGDVVTCRDWTELWLNEGFANFYEALFTNHAKGPDEFQLDMLGQANAVIGLDDRRGRKPIVAHDSYQTNIYSKGAWVLYMLRNILGEQEYRRAITYYLQHHAFASVSTCDLQESIEAATGQNMDWFFDQWVYKAGHPVLSVTSNWVPSAGRLELIIRQTQTLDSLTGLFRLPLDIECTTPAGTRTQQVWISQQEDTIAIELPAKPLMVIVDKGMKVLKDLTFEKSSEELAYQLLHAGDIAERMRAAKALKEYPGDDEVFKALRQSALNDPFWAVRREATIYLGTMKNPAVKDAMFEIYRDRKSSVRNAAVVALEQFTSEDVVAFLRKAIAADSSYLVQSSCLQSLAEIDSAHVAGLAVEFADMDSHRDILRRGALRVLRSLKTPDAIPVALKYVRPGTGADLRSISLGIMRDNGEKDPRARAAVISLAGDASTSVRKSVIGTLRQWGGEDALEALRKRDHLEKDQELKDEIESALKELDSK